MERGGEIFELLGVDVRVVGRIDKEKTVRPGVFILRFLCEPSECMGKPLTTRKS